MENRIILPFKDYNEFEQIDPYNTENKISGYISRTATEYYGALVITKINDKEIKPQQVNKIFRSHSTRDRGEVKDDLL